MVEDKPLTQFLQGCPGAFVQLVAGPWHVRRRIGTPPGSRIAWSKGKTAGYLALTLRGRPAGTRRPHRLAVP